jgi:hypothetical protein
MRERERERERGRSSHSQYIQTIDILALIPKVPNKKLTLHFVNPNSFAIILPSR